MQKRHMMKGTAGILLLCTALLLLALAGCTAASPAGEEEYAGMEQTEDSLENTGETPNVEAENGETLLKSIVVNMGQDKTVTDPEYDTYFAEGTAEDGVTALIAAGRFFINGFPIPADEETYLREYPDGFLINGGTASLLPTEEGYEVDHAAYGSYEEAARALVDQIRNGTEVLLYDTDGDGFADRVENKFVGAVIVGGITDNGDGTFRVTRSEPDAAYIWDNDGRPFDEARFSPASGDMVKSENLDASLSEGDMALFWYGPDGWVLERAEEVNGILVDGADHEYYQIDDVQYGDAMRFSRDNIIISNRCGEIINAHRYFGLLNNADGLRVSLWFVPTHSDTTGAPAGFTTGGNAAAFLTAAVAAAKEKLNSAAVSESGADVEGAWVTQEAYDALTEAIARAEAVLDSDAPPELMDYQVYLLYFALNGTGDDIGASFAGYDYVGFDHQAQEG